MCSVGDEAVDEDSAPKFMEQKRPIKDKICNKCKVNSSVVLLRSKDCYCKECFLSGTVHKFKSFLGKLRLSRVVERVLVSYETGHPSTALLHFLRQGLDAPAQKQMRFSPIVIYIEKNYQLSIEERKQILKQISDHVEQFNFKVYFVSFAEYVTTGKIDISENWNDLKLSDHFEELNRIFKDKTKLTYKKEIFSIYQRDLLINCAKLLKCSFIFCPDLTADIAVKLLTNVSLGRGNQLPLDIGIVDNRDTEVKIIKPLRYLNSKECAIYNYFNGIEPIAIRELVEKPYSSVQSLMTNFIEKLQVDYPATVNTVLRTGDKLTMDQKDYAVCEMCKAPVFGTSNKLTSSDATNFSSHLSTMKINTEIDPVKRYEEAIANYEERIDTQYCYTCKIISQHLV